MHFRRNQAHELIDLFGYGHQVLFGFFAEFKFIVIYPFKELGHTFHGIADPFDIIGDSHQFGNFKSFGFINFTLVDGGEIFDNHFLGIIQVLLYGIPFSQDIIIPLDQAFGGFFKVGLGKIKHFNDLTPDFGKGTDGGINIS